MVKANEQEEIEAPAVITPDFQQDRSFKNDENQLVIGKSAWRRLSPIQRAHEKGQISTEMFDAARTYEGYYDLSVSSGRNILDPSGGRSSGSMSLSQVQLDANKALALIEQELSRRDKAICQMVIGEGREASQAVSIACGADYKFAVMARLREALEGLMEALTRARRRPQLMVVHTAP